MSDTNTASVLKVYDGRRCRVFLTNGGCITGYVQIDEDSNWVTIVRSESVSCTINTAYIISIGVY